MTLQLDVQATARPTSTPRVSGFDEHLGAAERRYLGTGHRRVTFEVRDVRQTGPRTFAALAALRYPTDWSQKRGQTREPHLSTVDAIRISAHMRSVLARDLPCLAGAVVERSLTVRAGATPWTDLDAVPIAVSVDDDSVNGTVRLHGKIGSLTVDSTWESAISAQDADAYVAGSVSAVVLSGGGSVSCSYTRAGDASVPISLLEVLMLTAQMSQVVLYDGDGAERDRSGNMWMRRASFERRAVSTATTEQAAVQLRNRRTLAVDGRSVSTAEVLAEDIFGVYVTASLAMGS